MTPSLLKDLIREITNNKSRFISIFFIVTLGVAFFAGVRASKPDMLYSVDRYYDDNNFMDIRVLSTLGLTSDDVSLIGTIKGVEYAAGGRTAEVFCHFTDNSLSVPKEETKVLKIHEYIGGINEPEITEGETPKKADECLIDYRIANAYGVEIGDKITLIAADDEELSDTLNAAEYTVCGICMLPWYLTYDRGTGSIGSGKIDYFIMLPSAAFVSDTYTEIYIQVEDADELITGTDEYEELIETVTERIETLEGSMSERRIEEVKELAVSSAFDSDTYDEEYQKAYEAAYDEAYGTAYAQALETAKETARQEALETVKAKAYDEALAKVKEEALEEALETAKETARQEAIDTARSEAYETALATAKETAKEAAWQTVVDSSYDEALAAVKEQAYSEGLEKVNSEIESVVSNLVSAYCSENNEAVKSLIESIDDFSALVEKYMKEAGESLGELTDVSSYLKTDVIYALAASKLKEAAQKFEISSDTADEVSAWIVDEITPSVESLYGKYFETQFESVYKSLFDLQYESNLKEQYYEQFEEESEKTFEEEYKSQFDSEFEKTFNEQYLDTINEQFEETFDSQYAPLIEYQFEKTFEEEYKDQFDEEFEKTFEEEYLDQFNAEFEETFEKEYRSQFDEEFKETFESQYLDTFDEEFKKTFDEEFEEAVLDELGDITPTFYFLGRADSVATYIEYRQDAQAIGEIGNVFPLMFFLVAALVALTTMTRMVEDERLQMGTMKALGYSNLAITSKYVIYTLLAAVSGSILGCTIGEWLFPYVIMNAYGILFTDIPAYYEPFQWDIAAIACLAAVGTILAATLGTCVKSTMDKPASLMRPPAPKAGKRIFLEYIGIIWKHLNFTAKSSMRNLFRYKKRLFMTVFGIGGCMSLLLVGYGLRDSILAIANFQYSAIFVYDCSVGIRADASGNDIDAVSLGLTDYDGVESVAKLHSESVEVSAGDNSRSVYLYVPEKTEGIENYIKLADRKSGEEYDFPVQGVSVSEKTADQLGVTAGDTITIKTGDNTKAEVTVESVFENYVNHYVMMSRQTYESLFGKEFETNTLLINNARCEAEFENALSNYLMSFEAVSSVTMVSELKESLDNMLSSLDVVIWVLIVSAALLAFVVLYNLNNINISERRRELATIKVLGFYDGEVAAYVYRDNIWLTIFGCIAGCFLGNFLHKYIINTVDVDLMMFGPDISVGSYCLSAVLTAAFSAFVNFIMYFQLKNINMVESLKSVE